MTNRKWVLSIIGACSLVVVAWMTLRDRGPTAEDFFRPDAFADFEFTIGGQPPRETMSWSENLVVKLRGIPVPEIVGADGSRVYLYFVPLRSHKEEEILILDLFQQFHKGITYSVSLQGSVDGKSKNLTPKPPDKDYTGSQFCSLWGQQSFPEGVDLTAQPFDLQVWVFPYSFDSKTGQDVMTTGTLVYRQEMTIENAIHTSL